MWMIRADRRKLIREVTSSESKEERSIFWKSVKFCSDNSFPCLHQSIGSLLVGSLLEFVDGVGLDDKG